MATPTSSYGQPNWSDSYTAIPPGSGLQPGQVEILFDGTNVQFQQYILAATANKALTVSGYATLTTAAYGVTPTTALLQLVAGCNDRSGVTVGALSYAWSGVKGLCFPLVNTSVAANVMLVSSATNGTLVAVTAGTSIQFNWYNLVVVGGAPAASPVLVV